MTDFGPARMMFLAVSTPRPRYPTIRTFSFMSLPIVSMPIVPIALECRLVSIYAVCPVDSTIDFLTLKILFIQFYLNQVLYQIKPVERRSINQGINQGIEVTWTNKIKVIKAKK